MTTENVAAHPVKIPNSHTSAFPRHKTRPDHAKQNPQGKRAQETPGADRTRLTCKVKKHMS